MSQWDNLHPGTYIEPGIESQFEDLPSFDDNGNVDTWVLELVPSVA